MTARQTLKLLLALLVSAGLMFAPLATPAAAAAHPPGAAPMAMAHESDMSSDMADMAADMPCCPDTQKSSGCQDCPFVAICLLKALQAGPSTNPVATQQLAGERLNPLDDVIADGLIRPPPDHPPRSLV